jgi:hypothetical protein
LKYSNEPRAARGTRGVDHEFTCNDRARVPKYITTVASTLMKSVLPSVELVVPCCSCFGTEIGIRRTIPMPSPVLDFHFLEHFALDLCAQSFVRQSVDRTCRCTTDLRFASGRTRSTNVDHAPSVPAGT